MSYMDSLVSQVKQVFDQAQDDQDLFNKVLKFVQDKSKESFRNGLDSARNQRSKIKTRAS